MPINENQEAFVTKVFNKDSKGWRVIGGIRKYYRSKWEANYARYLQLVKEHNQIKDWAHEPKTFWFEGIKRGVTSFKIDFQVILLSGKEEWHEVKGYMDAKSALKIKRMAKYHPDIKLRVIDKDWFKQNNKKLKNIIKDWE